MATTTGLPLTDRPWHALSTEDDDEEGEGESIAMEEGDLELQVLTPGERSNKQQQKQYLVSDSRGIKRRRSRKGKELLEDVILDDDKEDEETEDEEQPSPQAHAVPPPPRASSAPLPHVFLFVGWLVGWLALIAHWWDEGRAAPRGGRG